MGKAYDVSSGKYEVAKKAFVVEGSKYVKLPKAFVVEGGKYVKLWSGSGRYVAVGSGAKALVSEDGSVWDYYSSGTGLNTYSGIRGAYGNGVFVILRGNDGDTDGCVSYYSYDGVTWLRGTVFSSAAGAANKSMLSFCNGKFIVIAASSGENVYTSPDGITWTLVGTVTKKTTNSLLLNQLGQKIVYGKYNGSYCYMIVGFNFTANSGTQILYSTDLLDWNAIYSAGNYTSNIAAGICCIDDTVYVAGQMNGLAINKVNTDTTGITILAKGTGSQAGIVLVCDTDRKRIIINYSYMTQFNMYYYDIGASSWTATTPAYIDNGTGMFPMDYCGEKYFFAHESTTGTVKFYYSVSGHNSDLTLCYSGATTSGGISVKTVMYGE